MKLPDQRLAKHFLNLMQTSNTMGMTLLGRINACRCYDAQFPMNPTTAEYYGEIINARRVIRCEPTGAANG